jgi:GT2 family glycosyltransferase
MSDKICYIPLRTGEDLLRNTIDGLYNQVDAFMVINSTERDLFPYFEGHDPEHKVNFINPTDPLCFEQAINVAIKTAYWLYKSPYIIWAHNDLVVYPGAIDALMETYEQYKDTKWGVIYGNYDVLCMFNPRFFVDEGIWGDPALFPNYFGDNHRYRLMDLRGYARINAPNVADKVTHIGSQTIRNSAYHGRINSLTLDLESQLYVRIWGGLAPSETNADPTCGGLYPLRSI